MPIELNVDQQSLQALRAACLAEADGKKLRNDLARDLRAALAPAVPEVQSAVRSLPAVVTGSPGLRDAVASQVRAEARLTGKSTGARIRVGSKKDPRGFKFAGRRLNNPKGWRHPVFGREGTPWVVQHGGRDNWFETTVLAHKDDYRRAVLEAMERMAKRIADRTTKGQQ